MKVVVDFIDRGMTKQELAERLAYDCACAGRCAFKGAFKCLFVDRTIDCLVTPAMWRDWLEQNEVTQ